MKTRIATFLATLALVTSPLCLAQAPSEYVPTPDALPPSAPPPTEALTRFASFLGLYEFTGDFSGEPYQGTLEVKPAVKGWYVEWVINIYVEDEDRQYDRQLRMLTTWDRFAEQYRIWRFETNNPIVMGEGKAFFEGDQFIMEWRRPAPDGEMGIFRNRITMKKPGEIVIISEGERDSGGKEQIGVGTGKRRQ